MSSTTKEIQLKKTFKIKIQLKASKRVGKKADGSGNREACAGDTRQTIAHRDGEAKGQNRGRDTAARCRGAPTARKRNGRRARKTKTSRI